MAVQLQNVLGWQLTGAVARDSRSMRGALISDGVLPESVIGHVTAEAAAISGLPAGVGRPRAGHVTSQS